MAEQIAIKARVTTLQGMGPREGAQGGVRQLLMIGKSLA